VATATLDEIVMDWNRVNVWTNTLYSLIHSLQISKQLDFGNLTTIDRSVMAASAWLSPECSYGSVLVAHPFGRSRITFRRDPNKHFEENVRQVVKMLIQDLVVIFDELMHESLTTRGQKPANFPQSKIHQLSRHLGAKSEWAAHGCIELVAVRNVLTHSGGRWNKQSIAIVSPFVSPPPKEGDKLDIGVPMLFRYRKAIRTFMNETALRPSAP
jgi:hypothetical protein